MCVMEMYQRGSFGKGRKHERRLRNEGTKDSLAPNEPLTAETGCDTPELQLECVAFCVCLCVLVGVFFVCVCV